MKLKPPADASDFLMVFYRASSIKNPGTNSAGEFDCINFYSLLSYILKKERSDTMRQQLQDLLQKRIQQYVTNSRHSTQENEKIEKKIISLDNRQAEIVKVKAKGYIDKIQHTSPEVENVQYHVHLQYLIKQKKHVYLEEEIEFRQAEFYKGVLVEDQEIDPVDL